MCHSLASEQLLGEQWQLLQVHRHQRDAETCTLIYLPERCSLDECPHFISWTDIKSMKENRNKHLKESQEWKQIDLDVFQCNCPIAYNEPACIHLSHLRKIQTIKAFFFSFFEDVGEAPEHLCLDHSVILKSLHTVSFPARVFPRNTGNNKCKTLSHNSRYVIICLYNECQIKAKCQKRIHQTVVYKTKMKICSSLEEI